MGKAVLMWLRKDSVKGAEPEAMDKHINTQALQEGATTERPRRQTEAGD